MFGRSGCIPNPGGGSGGGGKLEPSFPKAGGGGSEFGDPPLKPGGGGGSTKLSLTPVSYTHLDVYKRQHYYV